MVFKLMLLSGILFHSQDMFSQDERVKLLTAWNDVDRYRIAGLPDASTKGPFRVRLTPEASTWFLAYQKAVGNAKAPPTEDAKPDPSSEGLKAWETWVADKVVWDRSMVQSAADDANAAMLGSEYKRHIIELPRAPGVIPAELARIVGHPPPFAAVVAPVYYTIRFPDGDVYSYSNWAEMRPRYGYFRRSNGVVSYGTPLSQIPIVDLKEMYQSCGFTNFEQNVMSAVSKLEGGFDAINTYDTGFVSVGFLQFITGVDGKQSLSEVLAAEKRYDLEQFNNDFRDFGIDVRPDGTLCVVHPATGAELVGNEAVLAVIEDKRLTAIFQRAGRRSRAFRTAQLRTAKTHYWPMEDKFSVQIDGETLSGRVSDVVKSEAGAATLFDRKVNRGSVGPFGEIIARIMSSKGLKKLSDVTQYEREIIDSLRYRTNFLLDASLTQPGK